LTIHGSGLTEYDGQRGVRIKGPKTTAIPAESMAKLLQSFDQEHFFTLEDKAFVNCFHAPYETITISVDGNSKTVTGNDCYAKSGPKGALPKLAQEIDDTAGSEQWVKCEGLCQN